MAGGIPRKNGTAGAPKVFSGVSLNDFVIQFWAGQAGADLATDLATPDGAIDKIFRTAFGQIGTVNRIGTLDTTNKTLRFNMEVMGDETGVSGKLGTGNDNAGTNGYATTMALALQSRMKALGDITVTPTTGSPFTINLTTASCTVTSFTY